MSRRRGYVSGMLGSILYRGLCSTPADLGIRVVVVGMTTRRDKTPISPLETPTYFTLYCGWSLVPFRVVADRDPGEALRPLRRRAAANAVCGRGLDTPWPK